MTIIRFLKKILKKKVSNKMGSRENKKFISSNQLVSTTTIINKKKNSNILKSEIPSKCSLFRSKSSAMSKITRIDHTRKLEPIGSNFHSKFNTTDIELCKSCLNSKLDTKKIFKSDCKRYGKRIRFIKHNIKRVEIDKRLSLLKNKCDEISIGNNILLTDENQFNFKKKSLIKLPARFNSSVGNSKLFAKTNKRVYARNKNNAQRILVKKRVYKAKIQNVSNSQAQPCCLINGKPFIIEKNICYDNNSFFNSNKNQIQLNNIHTTFNFNFKNSFTNNLKSIEKKARNSQHNEKGNQELKKYKGMVNVLSGNIESLLFGKWIFFYKFDYYIFKFLSRYIEKV
jgi:hypothetical protein